MSSIDLLVLKALGVITLHVRNITSGRATGGAIHFIVTFQNTFNKEIDCEEVEIKSITMSSEGLKISGWLK